MHNNDRNNQRNAQRREAEVQEKPFENLRTPDSRQHLVMCIFNNPVNYVQALCVVTKPMQEKVEGGPKPGQVSSRKHCVTVVVQQH